MNAIRSPMAEGLIKLLHGRRVYVNSCGVRAGVPDGFAIEVMDELGVEISDHRPKTFDELEDHFYDLIITLSPEAQHKAMDMTAYLDCEVEFWNTFDPSMASGSREQRLDVYRQIRDQLMRKIRDRFPVHTVRDR